MLRVIGITTTVPSEIIFASGSIPLDLNNIFINSTESLEFIRHSERAGYPRNVCSWIKGIYGVLAKGDVKEIIGVTQGDCSNTHALMETLQLLGIKTIPFAFPYNRNPALLEYELVRLASELGTTIQDALATRAKLEDSRKLLDKLDEMTWKDNTVTGIENHVWLVSSSDFNGNPEKFSDELSGFIAEASHREPLTGIRLAYTGVPPVMTDLYDVIEESGGRVVFNEVQRQFSAPLRNGSLIEQYLSYTYPYGIYHRLDYIVPELERREIRGVIHYTQSFCHRAIEDIVLRKSVNVPVLTIEGENPGQVDARTKLRIHAFVEMLGES